MKDMSVIVVYHPDKARLLLHRRGRDPYRGLLDFVGGGCDQGESAMACAYRTLAETTGIGKDVITLQHIMDFAYHTTQWCVQVFAGELTREVALAGDSLVWIDAEEDFFDPARFAGEGYIGHILAHMRMQLFAPGE